MLRSAPGEQRGAGGQRRRTSGSATGSRATGSTRKASCGRSGYRRVGGRINLDFNPTGTLSLRTGLAVSGDRNNRVEGDGSDVGIITNAVGESADGAGRHVQR